MFAVEVVDFLVDAGTEEFADGEGFGEEVEGEFGGCAGGGLVVNGDGGHEGAPFPRGRGYCGARGRWGQGG